MLIITCKQRNTQAYEPKPMIAEAIALTQILNPKAPEPPQPKPQATVQVEPKQKKPKKIYYTVKKGDTLTKVSKRFRVPVGRVLCANRHIDNPDLILPSERLKIPQKKDKLKCPKIKSQGRKSIGHPNHSIAPSGWYPYGECTQYVWSKRPVGRWGNASTWYSMAQAEGWAVGSTPKVGAIGQQGNHVVYIEKVKGNQVYLSERNYDYNGSYRERWANASDFLYIY